MTDFAELDRWDSTPCVEKLVFRGRYALYSLLASKPSLLFELRQRIWKYAFLIALTSMLAFQIGFYFFSSTSSFMYTMAMCFVALFYG
jgi:hypothetical protein